MPSLNSCKVWGGYAALQAPTLAEGLFAGLLQRTATKLREPTRVRMLPLLQSCQKYGCGVLNSF